MIDLPPFPDPLTDTAVRQAKPAEKHRKLSDSAGLYLLVNKAGKYWRWKYRRGGKEKVMALGVYPDVTLAQVPGRRWCGLHHCRVRESLAVIVL